MTFCFNSVVYRITEIVTKSLLVQNKFMREMHLKQSGFTYNACGPFTKIEERIQKFLRLENIENIYKNDLDKAYFQHDMAYRKYKDLNKRTQSDKVLRDKAFEIASNPKSDGYKFLDKNLQWLLLNLCRISQFELMQVNFINQLLENVKKKSLLFV